MKHRLAHPILFLVAALALTGCDSATEPPGTYNIEVHVECDGCRPHPANDNIRLKLYPASAVMGDEIDASTHHGRSTATRSRAAPAHWPSRPSAPSRPGIT